MICCGRVSNNDVESDQQIKHLKIDQSKYDELRLNNLEVESIHYIPLETKAESLLGNVVQIKAIDNSLFIYDGNQILQFSKSGHFISNIGKKGKGPTEYVVCESYSTTDKFVFILDAGASVIKMYNHEGEYVQTIIPPSKIVNKIAATQEGILECCPIYNNNPDSFYYFDLNGG
jgi:hypothetical protein